MRSLSADDDATDAPSARFREHLHADESLVAIGSGTLVEPGGREAVTIGLTDRRLLSVAPEGGFVDVGYDRINSIRSRPRQLVAPRGNDHRLVTAVGALLALAALGGIALSAGPLASVLALATVGGVAAAVRLRRGPVQFDRQALTAAVDRIDDALGDAAGRRLDGTVDDALDGVRSLADPAARPDGARSPPGESTSLTEDVDRRQLLGVGSGLLAVAALAGAVALAGLLVVPLVAVAVGGLALVDYGRRHREAFDGIDVVRRRVREVSLHLVDGRAVTLRIDADERIDRELSRNAAGAAAPTAATELSSS